jgi:hypothetical protein
MSGSLIRGFCGEEDMGKSILGPAQVQVDYVTEFLDEERIDRQFETRAAIWLQTGQLGKVCINRARLSCQIGQRLRRLQDETS